MSVALDPLADPVLKTPDSRYIVIRGRLWRTSDPRLSLERRQILVDQLMDARRRMRGRQSDEVRAEARGRIDALKIALGERGPVWWSDGAPDFNRKMARNTPYASWFESLPQNGQA